MSGSITFKTAKDWWLGIALWLPPISILILSLVYQQLAGMIVSALCLVAVALIWFGTRYVLTDGVLRVYVGPFLHSSVAVADILSMKDTRTSIASPALSYDRLMIETKGERSLVISPRMKGEFVEAMRRVK